MNPCGVCRKNTFLLLATIFLTIAALAQTQSSPDKPASEANSDLLLSWKDIEKNISANAKPYLDYPLPELVAAVPELKGIELAASQEDLASLLDHVGEKCIDLLQRTPKVISHENVVTRQWMTEVISHGQGVPQITHSQPRRQEFEYLLLPHQTASGVELVEYRTDKHSRGSGAADFLSTSANVLLYATVGLLTWPLRYLALRSRGSRLTNAPEEPSVVRERFCPPTLSGHLN
jgi:hypothetical protein